MKHRAIVYHLYHKSFSNQAAIDANYAMMRNKQVLSGARCANGLDKHLQKK